MQTAQIETNFTTIAETHDETLPSIEC